MTSKTTILNVSGVMDIAVIETVMGYVGLRCVWFIPGYERDDYEESV